MQHFADRLLAACREKGAPVCVGLDPVIEKLPTHLGGRGGQPVRKIDRFCRAVIDASAEHVPAVKVQIACFERYGSHGYKIYEGVVRYARHRGLLVIADAKRGDIGVSSEHYAEGLLAGDVAADALTINGYLGADSLEPYIKVADREGAGLFVLVRTSNPGGDALQGLRLGDGRTVSDAVADMVAEAGRMRLGAMGYSLLGAVVGATKPADAVGLRRRMPEQVFLVPGFGAQGGTADDVRACFKPDGTGAIVTASRSVIYAYGDPGRRDWETAVADAARDLNTQIRDILRPAGQQAKAGE